MSQFICPVCGKFVSVAYYDPSEFVDDVLLVKVKGLGRGKGVAIVDTYSLLDSEETQLLEQIRARILSVHNLLFDEFDDLEEKYDELLNSVNDALSESYPEGFSDLGEAVEILLDEYTELLEESESSEE